MARCQIGCELWQHLSECTQICSLRLTTIFVYIALASLLTKSQFQRVTDIRDWWLQLKIGSLQVWDRHQKDQSWQRLSLSHHLKPQPTISFCFPQCLAKALSAAIALELIGHMPKWEIPESQSGSLTKTMVATEMLTADRLKLQLGRPALLSLICYCVYNINVAYYMNHSKSTMLKFIFQRFICSFKTFTDFTQF